LSQAGCPSSATTVAVDANDDDDDDDDAVAAAAAGVAVSRQPQRELSDRYRATSGAT